MTARTKRFVITLAALLFGGLLGAHFGSLLAHRRLVERMAFQTSTFTAAEVTVLQQLRNGETSKATELLEDLVDIQLLNVAADSSYSAETNAAIKKTYSQMRGYRAAYPKKGLSAQ